VRSHTGEMLAISSRLRLSSCQQEMCVPMQAHERRFSLTRGRRPIRKANAVFPAISPLLNGPGW
jgi:hypothetical protein